MLSFLLDLTPIRAGGKVKNPREEEVLLQSDFDKGPFKYYVIKEVGGWGQKMTIFDDLQCCKSSKRWIGGPKKVKNMMT